MSRRQTLADARLALSIRQLQEKKALLELQLQQQAAARAKDTLDHLVSDHLDSEAAWTAALQSPAFDPVSTGLWRARTAAALSAVHEGEESVAAEDEAVAGRRRSWATRLQLADAISGVERAAARALSRADDERRLHAVEETRHARRGRP